MKEKVQEQIDRLRREADRAAEEGRIDTAKAWVIAEGAIEVAIDELTKLIQ